VTAMPLTFSYVFDNTFFRFLGPFSGTRYSASMLIALAIGSDARSFRTGSLDFRNYFGISTNIGVAVRLSGGVSGGKNPQRFILGGLDNWLNRRFAQNLDVFTITDFYFSVFALPLRGADYYQRIGTHYFLVNTELRFPLINYLVTGFPLPLGFSNIRGAGFLDFGSAWNSNSGFRATEKNAAGKIVLRDVIAGFGWGFRMDLGIFLLRMDVAWRTDLQKFSAPRYLFSFGGDF